MVGRGQQPPTFDDPRNRVFSGGLYWPRIFGNFFMLWGTKRGERRGKEEREKEEKRKRGKE